MRTEVSSINTNDRYDVLDDVLVVEKYEDPGGHPNSSTYGRVKIPHP
jgi:hypothetical protein